jgi:23S rRNA pseudouridine1911/1915/1917 synthase
VHIPPPEPMDLTPEPIPLDILYEDADVLVIHKPAGMVVHPGAGHASGTLIHAVLAHCPDLKGVGGVLRPGLVHRLDKETSGVLLIAKHEQAYHFLQAQFKARTVRKVYDALVIGHPPPEGLIEAPIARDPRHRQRMAVVPTGRPARTRYRVVHTYEGRWGRYALLEVYPETGRDPSDPRAPGLCRLPGGGGSGLRAADRPPLPTPVPARPLDHGAPPLPAGAGDLRSSPAR